MIRLKHLCLVLYLKEQDWCIQLSGVYIKLFESSRELRSFDCPLYLCM